jgi:hypothetical protein
MRSSQLTLASVNHVLLIPTVRTEWWRRFSQPRQRISIDVRIDFTELISSAFSRRPRFRCYSAPKAHQENLENCAKLLETLGGEVAEWFKAPVC